MSEVKVLHEWEYTSQRRWIDGNYRYNYKNKFGDGTTDVPPAVTRELVFLARRVQRLAGALGHVHYLASKVEDKPEGRLIGIGDLARAALAEEAE